MKTSFTPSVRTDAITQRAGYYAVKQADNTWAYYPIQIHQEGLDAGVAKVQITKYRGPIEDGYICFKKGLLVLATAKDLVRGRFFSRNKTTLNKVKGNAATTGKYSGGLTPASDFGIPAGAEYDAGEAGNIIQGQVQAVYSGQNPEEAWDF